MLSGMADQLANSLLDPCITCWGWQLMYSIHRYSTQCNSFTSKGMNCEQGATQCFKKMVEKELNEWLKIRPKQGIIQCLLPQIGIDIASIGDKIYWRAIMVGKGMAWTWIIYTNTKC